jgi:integrase
VEPPRPPAAKAPRTVPLPRTAVDATKARLRDFPAEGPEGRILTAPQSGPVVCTHFMDGASWRPACAKAGIPKGTGPHALRHHHASLLIKHGESVKTVSERLNHTNAAMPPNSGPQRPPNPLRRGSDGRSPDVSDVEAERSVQRSHLRKRRSR